MKYIEKEEVSEAPSRASRLCEPVYLNNEPTIQHRLYTKHEYFIDGKAVTKEEYETTKAAFDKGLEAFL